MPEVLGLYQKEPRVSWDALAINDLLLWGTNSSMSDMALLSGSPAWMRLHGKWRAVTQRPITADELLFSLERQTKNNSIAAMLKSGQKDFDFLHMVEESRGVHRRYRCNAVPVADGYSIGVKIVFRAIPNDVPILADLNVEPEIVANVTPDNGLVLITGVMGSGKSTLLAAIIRHIIETGGRHVATYEAPIEFDFTSIPSPGGPITQTSIPEHLGSFSLGTRNITRTALDVVLIGESRDLETMRGMIEAADTGVAAYSTVHSRSVPDTISRITTMFSVEERMAMTANLLSSLRMIVSQRLAPLPDESGRVALREYLVFTPEIREELLDTPPERLGQKVEALLLEHGQTMQTAAERAYGEGKITREKYKTIMAERRRKTTGGAIMTQEQEKPRVPLYDVFSITEYTHQGETKHNWLPVGVAFVNRDGSFNLRLRAMPLTDPKTGTANLHMRLKLPKQIEGEQAAPDEDGDSFYLHIDPLDGAPLEAL
ncbi:type IV pilus twitching motility protein PilT [Nitratidesulfovibrio vulgaris]|uniref:type IV pilus twitching motility protein PilT n=1 Tax=Nitratidesulfovibrio vulgaris TaxID=881 RepID=UPI0022FFE11A|nr:ATPase, T2SS/T4P/T4SS family [Nitratidesulfovibrio vulgaris]WCB45683.1 ATPase, T2SS/T4P/T4SS family [Nitratidesulfovibrio vulgaris]